MSSPNDNTITSEHIDMNMLSIFASKEMTTTEHVTQTATSQPTSISGKLFRIFGSLFGMSNGSRYTDNIDTEHNV